VDIMSYWYYKLLTLGTFDTLWITDIMPYWHYELWTFNELWAVWTIYIM